MLKHELELKLKHKHELKHLADRCFSEELRPFRVTPGDWFLLLFLNPSALMITSKITHPRLPPHLSCTHAGMHILTCLVPQEAPSCNLSPGHSHKPRCCQPLLPAVCCRKTIGILLLSQIRSSIIIVNRHFQMTQKGSSRSPTHPKDSRKCIFPCRGVGCATWIETVSSRDS